MDKEMIFTAEAPKPIGPYSQAIRTSGFLYLSGQIGIDPGTSKLVEGGVEPQAHRIFTNTEALLGAAGLDFSCVIKVTVFLKEIADFKSVNTIYSQYFSEPFPARSAVGVRELPLGADIEIEMIAAC